MPVPLNGCSRRIRSKEADSIERTHDKALFVNDFAWSPVQTSVQTRPSLSPISLAPPTEHSTSVLFSYVVQQAIATEDKNYAIMLRSRGLVVLLVIAANVHGKFSC